MCVRPPPPPRSYNAVNGVPSCANSWLLKDLLRTTWQFDGYVTADCDADDNVFNNHHYTRTPEESVAAIVAAGQDVDCNYNQGNSFMTRNTQSAINEGLVKQADVDALLQRQFRLRLRLGQFEPTQGPLQTIGPDQVCTLAAIEMARDGARQGTVVLKNTANALPINAATAGSVVVIGPNAHGLGDITGYYGRSVARVGMVWVCDGATAASLAEGARTARPSPPSPPPTPRRPTLPPTFFALAATTRATTRAPRRSTPSSSTCRARASSPACPP